MLHTAMIVLHAAAGVVAFAAGCLVLAPDGDRREARLFQVYLVSLVLLVVFLVGALGARWGELDTAERAIFGALTLLGLFMVWRALAARGLLARQSGRWRLPYMQHVGFTLIALWDGFVIVAAIDLGVPVWLVVVLAVAGVVAGRWAVHRAEARAGATA